MKKKIEIACFSVSSAIASVNAGADRIELCNDYTAGGVTPSIECFEQLRKYTNIPVFVMLRPRGGNFVYSDLEFLQMQHDMKIFANAGADGFVMGIFKENNTVNTEQSNILTGLAGRLPCTFHKAFDRCTDLYKAADDIIACGFANILSSGKGKTAAEGAEMLAGLIEYTKNKISFIAGGGVRSNNLEELCKKVNTIYYHSAGIIEGNETDPVEVAKMKQILNKCSE